GLGVEAAALPHAAGKAGDHSGMNAQLAMSVQRSRHGGNDRAQPELQGVAVLYECGGVFPDALRNRVDFRFGHREQWGLGFNNLIELRDMDTKTAAHTWQARVQMRHLAPRLLPDNGCEIGGEAGGAPAVGIRGGELRNDGVEGICFTQETGNAVVIQRLKRGSSV